MNPVVLQFANGDIFFIGLAMVVMAAVASLLETNAILRSVINVSSLAGITFVLLSATPLSKWWYGIWVGLCLANLLINGTRISSSLPFRFRSLLFGPIAIASLTMSVLELPYHLSPSIPLSSNRHVFVIGDSISSGIEAGERTWPAVLGDLAHVPVTNLARPGATVASAMSQVPAITGSSNLVIVEIGGNDLIGGPDGKMFYNQLDQLLGTICSSGNQVVMFEIPLIPFRNSFGKTQRTLAKKYGVTLLPKKFLTNILGLKNGTLDGLHFSQTGHDAMAKEIYEVIRFNRP